MILYLLLQGHETTSGLLSFLFMLFLQNPAKYRKAQMEVDSVIGTGAITYEHMSKIPYITACLRETLRLFPTAPGFQVKPISKDPKEYPIFIGKERWEIPYGLPIGVILPRIHRDPAVWGEDAEEFEPERMLDEKFNKLPPNAWKVRLF
jgi:cytochrome P450/NADPH-cytochrome P450 reductase